MTCSMLWHVAAHMQHFRQTCHGALPHSTGLMSVATLLRLLLEQVQSNQQKSLLQGKVQEGDAQLSRLQTALQSQQTRNNQLQNTLQATEAQLQEANALTNAERLRVTLLQEAASAREAAVQLLHQQLEDAEQKVQQQGLELQVRLIQLPVCSVVFCFWAGFTA